MIRRGLQFVCLWMFLLGAAPCFSQSTNPPTYVTLQDFTNSVINGSYVEVGTFDRGSGATFQRYSVSGSPSYWVTMRLQDNGSWLANVHTNYPTTQNTGIFLQRTVGANGVLPVSSTGAWYNFATAQNNVTGTIMHFWTVPPADPYEQAFPDWESASVLIPLGFGFGMMFWASALALHVPMKWVRSLADAAS